MAWHVSIYGALGWNLCGSHSVCSAHEAFGLVRFHGAALECPGLWGGGPLWRSQRLYCLGSVGVGCFVAFTTVKAFGLPPLPFCGV